MKKHVMLASVMALALAVSPLSGMGMRVSAEEGAPIGAEVRTVSDGNNSGSEETQLAPPTNVRWEDNWFMVFDWVDWDGERNYLPTWNVEVCFNIGSQEFNYNREFQWWNMTVGDSFVIPFSQGIHYYGASYKFRVSASQYGRETSEWSEWSESRTYDRPAQTLEAVTGYWDTETLGLFHYTTVENAAGYAWLLQKWDDSRNQWQASSIPFGDGYSDSREWADGPAVYNFVTLSSRRDVGGQVKDRDFSQAISRWGEGKYRVEMMALSNNINEIDNAPFSPKNEEDYCILDTVTGTVTGGLQSKPNTGSNEGSSSSSGNSSYTSALDSQITVALSGTTVKITKDQNICSLSNSTMQQLLKRGDVALEMEYTYEGVDYKILIPAGAAMDNEIPWYGPLYLAQHYGVNNPDAASVYIVKKGDSLGKIARANNMTLSELAAKNPQIKNIDRIVPGQAIQID